MNEAKRHSEYGPGGARCACCGPSLKERPKFRRLIKHRIKAMVRKEIIEAQAEMV